MGGSAAAEDDQPVRGIVRGDRDRDTVARDDADVVAAHASANLCEELHAVVALHAVVPAGERFDDGPLDLNEIVASQGGPGNTGPLAGKGFESYPGPAL